MEHPTYTQDSNLPASAPLKDRVLVILSARVPVCVLSYVPGEVTQGQSDEARTSSAAVRSGQEKFDSITQDH